MANFGEANTWIQDSNRFELYADGSGKVRLRPATGEPVVPTEPSASKAGAADIAAVPTGQVTDHADPDADGDASR
ncbi:MULTISPECIES: hypothetical protein [unclassified Mycobacterium]|uniref:hypothetical protein n=1 Tax=unclassified Mycobacterium TaxID=2642494 RepID=UPI0029C9511D|nr:MULTISPECIES: hypothetical protein [unclassified Mycobacterium]